MAPKKQKIRKKQITPNEVELQDGNPSPKATKLLEIEVKESQVPEQDQTEEPVQSNSAQDTITTTDSKKRNSGGPRSVCAMHKVVVKKARGKKFVLHENVLVFLNNEMIGQVAISAYMMHLHTIIRERQELDTFAFCHPGATFGINEDFESSIINRLKEGNPDQVFFLPHNHSMHWILSIIWEGEIYILNPLPHSTHFPTLEKGLIRAVKSFNAQTGRGNHIPRVKILAGSPKQPGSHECGYVVMRHMKDIIEDKEFMLITKKWLSKSSMTYTQAELDEVRFEVLDYIQEFV